ncbi:MAG: cobalamin B12-binding domain-containing protein [Candidatus Binatia bacterium]
MIAQDKISDSGARLKSGQVELPPGKELFDAYLRDFIIAIKSLDRAALESALIRASLNFARPILVEQLIIPLLQKMGELWSTGFLRIVHERYASIVLRNFLGGMLDDAGLPEFAPVIIATTPIGQSHEFGILAASVMAVYDGWRVIYLGAELPTEEIAAAMEHRGAKALALSLVYPPDDSRVIKELKSLRRLLPASVPIVVGGRSLETYRYTLEDIGATIAHNAGDIRQHLRLIRCE